MLFIDARKVFNKTFGDWQKFTGICFKCNEGMTWKQKGRNRPEKRKLCRGYVKIYMPEYPFCDKRGEVYEHRYKMEQKLGRKLYRHEHIHHKNEIKSDNRIDNLEIISNYVHPTIHGLLKRVELLEKILLKNGIPIPEYEVLRSFEKKER